MGVLKLNDISYTGGNSGHNYSTDEQIIGTWIDNSPLYEKTFTTTTPIPWGTAFLEVDTMSISNLDKIIEMHFVVTVNEDEDSVYRTYPPSEKCSVMYNNSNSKLYGYQRFVSGVTGKSWFTVVTFRYTKTT